MDKTQQLFDKASVRFSFVVLWDQEPISPAASHNSVIKKSNLRMANWPKRTNFYFKLSCVRQLGKRARGPEERQN